MKLQDQVCTLEQAKRLKELGVKQEGFLVWFKSGRIMVSTPDDCGHVVAATAFTVAELGQLLPGKFQYNDEECFVDSTKYCTDITWLSGIHTVNAHGKPVIALKYFPGQTEAQTRASMLIHLLEKNDVTAEEVNKRLVA